MSKISHRVKDFDIPSFFQPTSWKLKYVDQSLTLMKKAKSTLIMK